MRPKRETIYGKTAGQFLRAAFIAAALVGAGSASGFGAQPRTPLEQAKTDAAKATQLAHRSAFDNARGLAKTNDIAAAESALKALNFAPPNSAAWRLETAQRLVQLAEQLARDGDTANLSHVLQSALQHLELAGQQASDAVTRSNAQLLSGFIQERFLANATRALGHYKTAATLAPDSAKAKEVVDRLKRADDSFRAKPNSSGK